MEEKKGAVEGITINEYGGASIVGEGAMSYFRLLQLRGAVKLEMAGLRHSSRRSVTAMVKREFGVKGSREKVLAFLDAEIERRRAEGK